MKITYSVCSGVVVFGINSSCNAVNCTRLHLVQFPLALVVLLLLNITTRWGNHAISYTWASTTSRTGMVMAILVFDGERQRCWDFDLIARSHVHSFPLVPFFRLWVFKTTI